MKETCTTCGKTADDESSINCSNGMHFKPTPQQSDWEKDWEIITTPLEDCSYNNHDFVMFKEKSIRFIDGLLQKERERMVSKLEGLKKNQLKVYTREENPLLNYENGYNDCLSNAILEINQ